MKLECLVMSYVSILSFLFSIHCFFCVFIHLISMENEEVMIIAMNIIAFSRQTYGEVNQIFAHIEAIISPCLPRIK